nr:MAG TPA: G-protein coupled receptor [Caudoviricetes sp.]
MICSIIVKYCICYSPYYIIKLGSGGAFTLLLFYLFEAL